MISNNTSFTATPRIPEAVAESLKGDDEGDPRLSVLTELVAQFNSNHDVGALGGRQENPSTPLAETARTLCRPAFSAHDKPLDVSQTLLPSTSLDVSQFESEKELLVTYFSDFFAFFADQLGLRCHVLISLVPIGWSISFATLRPG